MSMWKTLPQQGAELRELRLEGSGNERHIVVVPKTGERVRFAAKGDVKIETIGHVLVRSSMIDATTTRLTFSSDGLVLQRAEVEFEGDEADWDKMWRRARARSRPWWAQGGGDEVDLDWPMAGAFVLTATRPTVSPSVRPPPP
jgi:hypothetical protein